MTVRPPSAREAQYLAEVKEDDARRDSVPAAHQLLLLSGCLSLRAQQVKRPGIVLDLEGLDRSMYHCESTGRDLSTDAVASALGLLAIAAEEISEAERAHAEQVVRS